MTVSGQEIAQYVEQVRAALADLPAELRDELTEDLAEHLAEVAAEDDGSLVDRLGPAEAYAAELRSAAGVGVRHAAPNLDQRIAGAMVRLRARLRATDVWLGPVFGYASASEFLRLLRPAWWLLRGYLLAMLITVLPTGAPYGLLPRLGGSNLAALLLLAVCVVASIWIGRRTPRLPRWPRVAVAAGSLFLLGFALVGFVEVDQRNRWSDYGYQETAAVVSPYDKVRDVYVYDSQGRLVENARLFDQDGDPIRLGYPECDPSSDPSGPQGQGLPTANPLLRPYPYCPDRAPFRFGAPPPAASTAPAPTQTPSASATR